jgi:hypothetical protein
MANGGKITKAKAKAWVDRYKKKHDKDPKKLFSELFDKSLIEDLLKEPGCAGLRVYNSYDENDDLHFVLVGTDANGNDLLPTTEESTTEVNSIVEDGRRCPPFCPPGGGL